MTSCLVLRNGFACTLNSQPSDDMFINLNNEILAAAAAQACHEHDLSPHLSLPVAGCWHMVRVPQLFHRRLSWAGTRDQGRAHTPGDFLQQPRTLQL